MTEITWQDFEKVDLRIGTIISACDFPKARNPSFQLQIDFGSAIGIKASSAQITKHYTLENLIGQQVICVVNFPRKQIANFFSEVLVTGFADENGDIILAQPSQKAPNGAKLV
jgi:tRNA-binding protein